MRKETDRRKRVRKLLLTGWAAILAVLLIGSCGRDGDAADAGDYLWVSEFLPFEMEEDSYSSMAFHGNALYYISYQLQGEGFLYRLSGYSLTEGRLPDLSLDWQEEKDRFVASLLAMGEDGSFFIIAHVTEEEGSGMHLYRFDADGKQLYDTDISGETDNVELLAVDGQGRAYVSCTVSGRPGVLLYTSDGSFRGTVMPDVPGGRITAMGQGPDGLIYACCQGNNGGGETRCLTEIDFDNGKAGASYTDFPSGDSPALTPGMDHTVLSYDRTALYAYDLTDHTGEALFDWLDQDINGSYVTAVHLLEDNRILAVIRNLSAGSGELALLKKVDSAQARQKKTLVLGTLYSSTGLRNTVLRFNRSNNMYHVKIREYLDPRTHDRSDALIRMNSDILSDNCPDILDLADLDLKALASKGMFADLNDYLEGSRLLSRQDFPDSLLDGFTVDGKLVTIPSGFSLRTVFGWSDEVGDDMGWTLNELMAYGDAHPDAEFFDHASRGHILQYLLAYNEDAFIDWSSGQCSFDSDAFRQLLEFAGRFSGEARRDPTQSSAPVRIRNGEVLLYEADITDFDSIQLALEIYDNRGTCIGFPASDGSAGCMLVPYGAYAVTVKSNLKEGAWQFMESLLTAEEGSSFFPPRKELLAQKAADALKAEYLTDETGEVCLDENGEPIPKNTGMTISYPDWEYTYRTASRDEVDLVLSLIDAAKPVSLSETNEVLNIIREESESYYLGQKTVAEVAEIIQSRVRIYVNEH